MQELNLSQIMEAGIGIFPLASAAECEAVYDGARATLSTHQEAAQLAYTKSKAPAGGYMWQKKAPFRDPLDPTFLSYASDPRGWGWAITVGSLVIDIDHPHLAPPGWQDLEYAGQATKNGQHLIFNDPGEEVFSGAHGKLMHAGQHYGEWKRVGGYLKLHEMPNDEWMRGHLENVPDFFLPGVPSTDQRKGSANDRTSTILKATPDITKDGVAVNRNNAMAQYLGLMWNQPGITQEHLEDLARAKARTYSQEGHPFSEEEAAKVAKSISRYKPKSRSGPDEAQQPPEREDGFLSGIIPTTQLGAMDFPVRHKWGPTPFSDNCSLMLYARSGVGKSRIMMGWIDQAARSRPDRRILYLNSEMPDSSCANLVGKGWDNVDYLAVDDNQFLAHTFDDYDLVVLDTKTGAYSHKESENQPEHWVMLSTWIKERMVAGKATGVVSHAGKNVSLGPAGSERQKQMFELIIGIERKYKDDTDEEYLTFHIEKNREGINTDDFARDMAWGGEGFEYI